MKTKEIYSIFGGKKNTPTKKVINDSTKGRKSEIAKETIKIKKERQSLRAVVAFIATEEAEEAANFRSFFGIPKNANKAKRDAICAIIDKQMQNFVITTAIKDGAVINEEAKFPVNKNGKRISDYLDVLKVIRAERETRAKQRTTMCQYLIKARNASQKRGNYRDALPVMLDTAKNAPAKYVSTELTPSFIVVDGVTKYTTADCPTIETLVAKYATQKTEKAK